MTLPVNARNPGRAEQSSGLTSLDIVSSKIILLRSPTPCSMTVFTCKDVLGQTSFVMLEWTHQCLETWRERFGSPNLRHAELHIASILCPPLHDRTRAGRLASGWHDHQQTTTLCTLSLMLAGSLPTGSHSSLTKTPTRKLRDSLYFRHLK